VLFRSHDGVAILHLDGAIDINAARVLREHFQRALQDGRGCVVDVRDVSFVDSAALGALLEAKQRSEQSELPFLLVLPEGRHAVGRALALAGLSFESRRGLAEALRAAYDRHGNGNGDARAP